MGLYRDLEDKRVVITGAASGIGLATAKRFLDENSHVFIIDWNEAALKRLMRRIPDWQECFARTSAKWKESGRLLPVPKIVWEDWTFLFPMQVSVIGVHLTKSNTSSGQES